MEHQLGILRVLRAQQTRGALSQEQVVAVKTAALKAADDPALKAIWAFFEETGDEADLVDNLLIFAGFTPSPAATPPAASDAAAGATVASPAETPVLTRVPTSGAPATVLSPPVSAPMTAHAAATSPVDAAVVSALEPSLLSAAHRWDIVYLFSEPLILLNYASGLSQPLTALDFDTEIKWMTSALRDANRSVNLYTAPATVNNINQALASGETSVLHLSGHGWQNGIALEGENGRAQILSYEDFKERLGEQFHNCKLQRQSNEHNLRLVFVSSCHSESVGRAFAECGVPHVVAIKSDCKVTDEGAQLFVQQFYTAIITGQTVAQAFRSAQTSVRIQKKHVPEVARDADAFILMGAGEQPRLPDPSLIAGDVFAKHQVPIFNNLPIGELQKVLPPTVIGCSTPDIWIGRQNDIQQTVSHLCGSGSIVTVMGPPGIGKSSLAKVAAHYVATRKYFSEGVYYIDCSGLLTVDALITLICDTLEGTAFDEERDGTPANRLQTLLNRVLEDTVSSLLLVLDNLDVLLIVRRDDMRRFLGGLFERRKGLKIMAPLGTDLGDVTHTTAHSVVLKKLSDAETARMLVQTVQSPIRLSDLQRSLEDQFGESYVKSFLESLPEVPSAPATTTPLTSRIPATVTSGPIDTTTAAAAALTLTSSITTPVTTPISTPHATTISPEEVIQVVSNEPSAEFVTKYETLENIAELIADSSPCDAESKHSSSGVASADSDSHVGDALAEMQFHDAIPEEKPTRTERLSHRQQKRRQYRSLAGPAAEKPPGSSHRSSSSRSERSQLGSKIPLRPHRKSRATSGQSSVANATAVAVNLDASVRACASRFLDVFRGFLHTHAGTPGLLNCVAPVLLLQQHPIIPCLQGHPIGIRIAAGLMRYRTFADVYHVMHTHPARGEWLNQVPESDISQVEESLRMSLLAVDGTKKGALEALYLLSLLPSSLRLHHLRGIWPSRFPLVSTESRFTLTTQASQESALGSVVTVQALPFSAARKLSQSADFIQVPPDSSQTVVPSVQITSPVTSPVIAKSDGVEDSRGPIDDFLEPLLRAYLVDKVTAPVQQTNGNDDRTSGSSELLESSSSGDEEAFAFSAFLFGPDEPIKFRGPPEEKYLYGESDDVIVLTPVLSGLVRQHIPADEKALLISSLAKFCAKILKKIYQTMRARRVSHEFDTLEPVVWRMLELAVDESALTLGDIVAHKSNVGDADRDGNAEQQDKEKEPKVADSIEVLMAEINTWLTTVLDKLVDMPDWSSVDRATLQQRSNATNFGCVAALFPRILVRLGRSASDVLEACKTGANVCRAHFDLPSLAGVFHTLAQHYQRNRQYDFAYNYACKCTQLYLTLENVTGLGYSCHLLGSLLAEQQSFEDGVMAVQWARTMFDAAPDQAVGGRGKVLCMRTLGDIYRKQGKFEEALAMFESVIEAASEIGDRIAMVNAVVSMAHALFKDHHDKKQPFPPSVLDTLGKQLDWAISISCSLEYKQGIGMSKAWRSVVCYYSALQALVLSAFVGEAAAAAAFEIQPAVSSSGMLSNEARSLSPVLPHSSIPAVDRELVRGLSRGCSQSSSDTSPDSGSAPTAEDTRVSSAWDLMRLAETTAVESLELLHETGEDLTIPRMTLEHMRRFLAQIR